MVDNKEIMYRRSLYGTFKALLLSNPMSFGSLKALKDYRIRYSANLK